MSTMKNCAALSFKRLQEIKKRGIEFKGLKTIDVMDGDAYSFNFYKNGKKIGTVCNLGNGSPIDSSCIKNEDNDFLSALGAESMLMNYPDHILDGSYTDVGVGNVLDAYKLVMNFEKLNKKHGVIFFKSKNDFFNDVSPAYFYYKISPQTAISNEEKMLRNFQEKHPEALTWLQARELDWSLEFSSRVALKEDTSPSL